MLEQQLQERREIIEKIVKEAEDIVDKARENIWRLEGLYESADLEREKPSIVGKALDQIFTAKYIVNEMYMELEEKGGDPRLIIGAKRLRDLLDQAEDKLYTYMYRRGDSLDTLEMKGVRERWIRGTIRKRPIYRRVIPKEDVQELREVLREYTKAIGRKCGFSIPYRDKITVAELVNDLSNCIHVYAEELGKYVTTFKEVEGLGGKLYATSDADKDLLEIGVQWVFSLQEGNRHNLYFLDDLDYTKGYIVDGRAYFRVGSSKGHATTIEKEDGELQLRYYDDDLSVNETLKELIEKYGDCKCTTLDDGVKCKCKITPRSKQALAIAMSLATSMDLRFMDSGETDEDQEKHFKEILEYLNREHVKEDLQKVISQWRRSG